MLRAFQTILASAITGFLLSACAATSAKVPERTDILKLSTTTSEGRRVVTGRLSFPSHEHSLKIENSGFLPETISAGFSGKKTDFGPVDPAANHQVELLTTVETSPFHVLNSVVRVSRDGRVIYDESICPLHRRSMKRQIEDSFSPEAYPESFFTLQKKSFPNDGNTRLLCGGGIRHPLWKCPDCYAPYLRAEKRLGIRHY